MQVIFTLTTFNLLLCRFSTAHHCAVIFLGGDNGNRVNGGDGGAPAVLDGGGTLALSLAFYGVGRDRPLWRTNFVGDGECPINQSQIVPPKRSKAPPL